LTQYRVGLLVKQEVRWGKNGSEGGEDDNSFCGKANGTEQLGKECFCI
jgi:hypothetical protein